jgi:hypothetical protein
MKSFDVNIKNKTFMLSALKKKKKKLLVPQKGTLKILWHLRRQYLVMFIKRYNYYDGMLK